MATLNDPNQHCASLARAVHQRMREGAGSNHRTFRPARVAGASMNAGDVILVMLDAADRAPAINPEPVTIPDIRPVSIIFLWIINA